MKQLTIQRESLSFLALTRSTVGLLEPIYLQETYIRAGTTMKEARDHSYQYSKLLWETEVFQTWATWSDFAQLYKELVHDHGACLGKIYRESIGCKPVHIGYTFRRWDIVDAQDYIKDTWVKLYRRSPQTFSYESVRLS